MSTWILSMIVPLVIGVLWHGLSLKVAVALAGEQSPGLLRTAWVSWMGGLLGMFVATGFAWTAGWAFWWLSATLAALITLGVQLITTSAVYKSGLRLSWPAAIGVTGIHAVLSLVVNAALGWFVYSSMV